MCVCTSAVRQQSRHGKVEKKMASMKSIIDVFRVDFPKTNKPFCLRDSVSVGSSTC